MEDKDLKNIWKKESNKEIICYTEKQLNDMVVKNARKLIKGIYPGWIFHLVVIGIVMLIIYRIVVDNNSVGVTLLHLSALLILAVCYPLWLYSAQIMKEYKYNVPIKQWLEYRIKEVEKSIRFSKKYNALIYGFAFLVGFGFYLGFQFFYNSFNPIIAIVAFIAFIIYFFIVRRSIRKNYDKTLDELKDLYKQLSE